MRFRHILSLLLLVNATLGYALPVKFGVPVATQDRTRDAQALHALDDAARAGARLVVLRADWQRIQPDAATWNFTWLDALVDRARARQMEVVLTFGPAPAWTVPYLTNPSSEQLARAKPRVPALLTYVSTVTKRYQQKVRLYQVWEQPNSAHLLAVPREAHTIFRAVSKTVHGVDPTLRVIVPEPGNVQLGWTAEYLAKATGAERPDILLVNADAALTAEALGFRLETLRTRLLTGTGKPLLWGRVTGGPAWATAAMMLFHTSTLVLQPEKAGADLCVTPDLRNGLTALAGLTGGEYRGWQSLPGVTVGLFAVGTQWRALCLPGPPAEEAATLRLAPGGQPLADAIAIPAARVTLTPLGQTPEQLAVTEETPRPLPARPFLLGNVLVTPRLGAPSFRPAPVAGESVHLDLNGDDPAGIHALPALPGGGFQTEQTGEARLLCTVCETAPWIHLDVPDGFLFCNLERRPVEVAVRVAGAREAQKTGFSLMYDTRAGMTYTPWQWIDQNPDPAVPSDFTYTFRLADALFANSDGYDLRIDMGGSREAVRVLEVTIRKLAMPEAPSAGTSGVPKSR